MQESLNPWVISPSRPENASEEAPDTHTPPAAVISAPLRGLVEPDAADRLACRTMTGTATLWITGAHGGAGETIREGIWRNIGIGGSGREG